MATDYDAPRQNDDDVLHKMLDIIREKDAEIRRLTDIILKERARE